MIQKLLAKLKPEPAGIATLRKIDAVNKTDLAFGNVIAEQRTALEAAGNAATAGFWQNPNHETLAHFLDTESVREAKVVVLNRAQRDFSESVQHRILDRSREALIDALNELVAQLQRVKTSQETAHDTTVETLGLSGEVGGTPIADAIARRIKQATGYLAIFTNDVCVDYNSVGALQTAIAFVLA